MDISFRHSAGFSKRYNLVGKMLMEDLNVYLSLVDGHGVDGATKKEDSTFIEVQIKIKSSEVTDGDRLQRLKENFKRLGRADPTKVRLSLLSGSIAVEYRIEG